MNISSLLQVIFHIGKKKPQTFLSNKVSIAYLINRSSEDTILLILKEILKSDGFESETRFETIEQMIKSNVLNCFSNNQTNQFDAFHPYLSPKTS
jgi:hypothetical protein